MGEGEVVGGAGSDGLNHQLFSIVFFFVRSFAAKNELLSFVRLSVDVIS